MASARAFAAEGAGVILHYHTKPEPVEELYRDVDTETVIIRADLRDRHQVDAMFGKALETFPRVDAIVVNAGIWTSQAAPIHEMTADQWQATLDADLSSAFFTCQAFLRHIAQMPRECASSFW